VDVNLLFSCLEEGDGNAPSVSRRSPEISSATDVQDLQEFVDEGLLEHHVAEIGHVEGLESGAVLEHKVCQLWHHHTLSQKTFQSREEAKRWPK